MVSDAAPDGTDVVASNLSHRAALVVRRCGKQRPEALIPRCEAKPSLEG
jgi:hypothetical protein